MPRQNVTLTEVARQAGVHPGTASRALNEATQSLVKPETVERVNSVAARLGYKPDYLARSLKTRRTLSVGVIFPDINNPLFPPMLRGLEDRLAQHDYLALLANTENDDKRERRIVEQMTTRQVDALVLATARRDSPHLAALANQGTPIVLFNRIAENHAFSSVSVDDGAGSRLAVEHLIGLGHSRIAHVAGPQSFSTGLRRYRGYVASTSLSRAKPDRSLVAFATSFTIAEGVRCARKLLSLGEPPSAIVAGNDMLALGCYSAIEEEGLSCPEDVSVVGFNDMPFMDRIDPPLTTIRIPQYEMGLHAADLVLERIRQPDDPLKVIVLAPELVVRRSTCPPRARGQAETRRQR